MDCSVEKAVARRLVKIADQIEPDEKRGGRNWTRGAIKRLLANEGVSAFLSGKQYGVIAAVKIAISKAETVADLRRIAEKLNAAD